MSEPIIKKPKRFSWFIGIDVSRNKLDYAVVKDNTFLFHKVAKNDPVEIKEFVLELKAISGFTMGKAVFCMEHTGFYCNHLLTTLKKAKAQVAVENGLVIRNSSGLLRGKDRYFAFFYLYIMQGFPAAFALTTVTYTNC